MKRSQRPLNQNGENCSGVSTKRCVDKDERTADRERLAALDMRMMGQEYWASLKEAHADCRFLRRLLREAQEREGATRAKAT